MPVRMFNDTSAPLKKVANSKASHIDFYVFPSPRITTKPPMAGSQRTCHTPTGNKVVENSFFSPRREVMVKPTFNRDLSLYWLSYGLSTMRLWELMLGIWFGFDGVLYDLNRDPIDLWEFDANGDDYIDRLSGDPRRSLDRYLEFGTKTKVNRLRKEMHDLAVMLHHARSIQQWTHNELRIRPTS